MLAGKEGFKAWTNSRILSTSKEPENFTGVPVLLNTSFNENEPVVYTPHEALDCFFRTKMDVLIPGSYLIIKNV